MIFHQYPTLAGGLNMASRPQYIAIPPSFDNTRKNLLARIEILKKIQNYSALGCGLVEVCTDEDKLFAHSASFNTSLLNNGEHLKSHIFRIFVSEEVEKRPL